MHPRYPHDLDLGEAVPERELRVVLEGMRDSVLVRGVLQKLRDKAAELEREGRQPPAVAPDRLEYRAYHAGGADALEEALMELWAVANPPDEVEQAPAGEG